MLSHFATKSRNMESSSVFALRQIAQALQYKAFDSTKAIALACHAVAASSENMPRFAPTSTTLFTVRLLGAWRMYTLRAYISRTPLNVLVSSGNVLSLIHISEPTRPY